MMKKSRYFEEDNKKTSAAAENFSSTQSMNPPSFMSMNQEPAQNTQESSINAQEVEPANDNTHNNEVEDKGYATINPNKLFHAVRQGHQHFKQTSVLSGVNINSSIAIGAPGCLHVTNVKEIIYAQMASELGSPENRAMGKAISKVIGRYLAQWGQGFQIPGQNWYPLYTYVPAPIAPHVPNIPVPLVSCPSIYEFYLTHKQNMINEIMSELPRQMDNDVNRDTVEQFSDKTVDYFQNWLNNSYLTNIIGHGLVPGFRPPFSFGGPVIGGTVIPRYGVLS